MVYVKNTIQVFCQFFISILFPTKFFFAQVIHASIGVLSVLHNCCFSDLMAI